MEEVNTNGTKYSFVITVLNICFFSLVHRVVENLQFSTLIAND
jgi:hypothetical protein